MKKVLSFCVLSVLLAVLSLGLKAQSGLVLTPANLPDPIELNQYDTIYFSPNSPCFDALGFSDGDKLSIEWQVLYNGSVIPNDSLSFYFEEFKFESRHDLGSAERWWGRSYTSAYCQNGNGYGSYPGANTPTAGTEMGQQCEDPGHFIVSLPGQNNPYQLDYFYVRWFKDAAVTGHRLVYNIKVDGEYEFVFSLAKRIGGTKEDGFTVGNDETYYIGGHQSVVDTIVSSDTLRPSVVDTADDIFICLTLLPATYYGVEFPASTPEGVYDTVGYIHGSSSCGSAVDSIIYFTLTIQDPQAPILDTNASTLMVCDSGYVTFQVNPQGADKVIWYDNTDVAIDTTTGSYTMHITANTEVYVKSFSAEGCVSSDSLRIFAEVKASPSPVVTAVNDSVCENDALKISLDNEYDVWTWYHDGVDMHLDTIVYDVADVATTDAGWYLAEVTTNYLHSVYSTIDTLRCSAADSVQITVFERPSVAWASLDGTAVSDSTTFCPNDLTHVLVATISGGQTPYDNINWTGTGGTRVETYGTDKVSDTLTITATATCGAAYTVGINHAVDANGCTLKDSVNVTFFVNDTLKPTVAKTKDTVSAPAYGSCEYIIPDVMGIITTSDNCGLADTAQVPQAGQHVTTDTIVVVTVTDLCGNTASDTIQVTLPVSKLVIDTVEVTQTVQCAGDANGAIRITVANGVAPYDVRIQSIMVSDSIKNAHGTATQTVFDFDGLIEGKWVITVTDTNGCTAALDTVDVASPNVLTITSSDWTDLTCFESNDGSFKFNVKQGTAPYEVKIVRTLETVKDSVEMTLNSARLDTIVTMTNQKAGIYVISVVDGNGCTTSTSDTLTQPDQLVLVGDTVLAHVLCFGDTIGNLAVTGVTGGTYPYYYAWVNSAMDTVSTDSITGPILRAGIYTIYVTDAHGCTANQSLTDTIQQPEGPLTLTASEWTDLTCFESNDGSFKYNVKEGTAPYYVTIERTLGATVETINDTLNPSTLDTIVFMQNMKAGIYVISVVDDHGCVVDSIRDTLTQPDALVLVGDTILNHVRCYGESNGNLAVTGVTGGTLPYSYTWVDTAMDTVSTDSVTGRILPVGTYTIYLTDANNCPPSDTLSSTILGPDTLEVLSLVAPVNDTCPHLGNYQFTAEVQGGRTDYTFQWTFNTVEVRNHITDALKDTFNYNETVVSCDTTFDIVFTVTDDSACTASKNITFTISDTLIPILSGTIDTVTMDGCVAGDAPDTLNTIAKLLAAGLTISDNCTPTDSLTVNYSEVVTGTCPIEIVRTYSVTDKCGLTSEEITQVFYVQDTTKPVFTTLPVSDTVACNGSGNIYQYNNFISNNETNVAATDNCGTVNVTMAPYDTIVGCNSASKTYVYSFTAADPCGNTTVEYAYFVIIDNVKPNIVPAPDVTMECSIDDLDTIRAHSLTQFTYDDACAHNATFVSDSLSEWTRVCGSAGYYTHYVTVTDSCQQVTASHKISIVDTKDPVFTNPPASNPVVECDGSGNLDDLFSWLYGVTAYDSCSGPIDSIALFFVDPMDGSHLIPFDSAVARDVDGHYAAAWVSEGACNGYYRFHWEATDSCGNVASTTEDFRIKDRKGPVFSEVRNDTIVNCDYTVAQFNEWLTLKKAYDVCSRDSIDVTYTTVFVPNCGNTGVYQVEWKSKDVCDSTVHHANWTIIDTVAPAVVTNNSGNLLSIDTVYHDCVHPYNAPILETWTKTDMTEAQSATFVSDFISGNIPQLHGNAGVTSISDCGYIQHFYLTNRHRTEENACDEKWTIDYVFVDACGNSLTLTQEIVVLDTCAPVVRNIADTKYLTADCEKQDVRVFTTIQQLDDYVPNDSYNASPADLHISSIMDEPGKVSLVSSVTTLAPGSLCDSIEVRTYRIWDACDNDTVFTHTIRFVDTVAPVITPSLVYDTIHQMPYGQCDKYYELEAGLLSNAHITDIDWWSTNYNVTITSCHTVTISLSEETVESDPNVCPGKVLVKKFKVNKKCDDNPSHNYASYFTLKLIVKDTIAPELAVANLTSDTVYTTNPDECGYTVPNVHFTDYTQLETWQGATVANDCNLAATNNVMMIDSVIVGSGCTFDINYRYTLQDSCGNVSDTIRLTITVMDTLAPMVTNKYATVVDTQYYEVNCDIPVLNKWTTPQDALDHGVVFKDCNPAWDNPSKLVLLDSVYVRNVCTIEYTVSYQVKDACTDHLSDTIYQSIMIFDTVAPVVTPEILDTLVTYMVDDATDCWGTPVAYFSTVADVKAYDTDFNVVDCNVGDDSEVELVSEDSSSVMCTRIVLRNYVVKDSCGLASNVFTQTIFVEDTVAPVITASLTPDTVYMDQNCDYTHRTFATIGDLPTDMQNGIKDCNLKDELILVSADTIATGSVECYKAYTVFVNYQVQDSCGHTTNFSDTIYVADTIAPAIAGRLDTVTIYTDEVGCGYTIPAATTYASVDDLPASITITDCKLRKDLIVSDIDTISGYCPMLIHRTYTVKDSCGHESKFNQFYEVYDTFAPKVTNTTLENDTVYITETGTYSVDPAYTTVTELNAHHVTHGAGISDCNLIDEINSCKADTIIDHTVCYGSYITRKYTVKDSCTNISDTIVHKIILRDTVKPYMDNTMPDTIEAFFVDPCTFQVPDMRDTVASHYADNWTTSYDAAYFVSQIPDAGMNIINQRDTFVVVSFKDACDNINTDTVYISVPEPLEITTISMEEPQCYDGNDGKILMTVTGGAPDYTYSYSGGSFTASVTDTLFKDVVAGTYIVTVTDSYNCTDTAKIVVTQPDEVTLTPLVLHNYENCITGTGSDTTEIAILMAGGVANYNVLAVLYADDMTTVLDTLLNMSNIASASDTVKLDPTVGDYYVTFFGEDSHHCSMMDTSAMISVYPVYSFTQSDRVCFNTEYKWGRAPGDTITYPAGYFPVADSTYTLVYATSTSHGCDSIYTMLLRVEDIPYLRVRSLRDAQADMSNAIEQTIYDTFNIASTNVGWEIFIDKNCMGCGASTDNIKDPVSIEYDLYRYNEVTDSYELMSNVTDFFRPYYRTFMDNYELAYTPSNTSHVSIPDIYEPHGNGTDWHFDFFNLCWFAPDYDEAALPSGHEHTSSGDYYQDARANTINISSFVEEGDYLIVATMYRRVGSSMNPSGNFSWNLALNIPMGGSNSSLGEPYGLPTEIYFHVDASSSPVIHMPSTDPIGGDVVFHTNKEVDASAHVYPNPARDYVQVELSGFEGQTDVVLSSTGGKVIKTIKLDIADKTDTPIIKIETGDFAQGVYMITARNKETIITKRVIIIR